MVVGVLVLWRWNTHRISNRPVGQIICSGRLADCCCGADVDGVRLVLATMDLCWTVTERAIAASYQLQKKKKNCCSCVFVVAPCWDYCYC